MDLRTRPQSDYLHTAEWQELYVLTEHWQSDMTFYGDELRFLKDLVGKYFVHMVEKEKEDRLQKMVADLTNVDKMQEDIAERIQKHLTDLRLLMENAFSHDAYKFRKEHVQLEEDMVSVAKEFREVKKEVFTLTEHVLASEKLQHLLAE